jgi:probable HAF family extracellular repeat protein
VKLFGQTVPPELQALYKALIAKIRTTPSGVVLTRTTKKARAPAPTRRKRQQLIDYEQAVDYLIAYLTKRDGVAPPPEFRATQISYLKWGYFESAYWVQCQELTKNALSNAPVSVPYAGPRAYAYPDPANVPSVPNYGNGSASSAPLTYNGATIAGMFVDLSLKWYRYTFRLEHRFKSSEEEPLFIRIDGSITASGDKRCGRAMLSAIWKAWAVPYGDARLTTTEPPTTTPRQAYYRYRRPTGTPPYYHFVNPLRLVYSARVRKYEDQSTWLKRFVLLIAPMPMMGKRYNNNTAIQTTLTVTNIRLYQIKKGPEIQVGYSSITGGSIRACKWDAGIVFSLGTLGGSSSQAYCCSSDSKIIVGYSQIAITGYTHAFSYYDGVMHDLHTSAGTGSVAYGCSDDGYTTVGYQTNALGHPEAHRWIDGTPFILPTLGGLVGNALGCSSNGRVIVGVSSTSGTSLNSACRWVDGIIENIHPPASTTSRAQACSSDGSIILITGGSTGKPGLNYLWEDGTFTPLGNIGATSVFPTCITADGAAVYGWLQYPSGVQRSFKWTASGMVEINFGGYIGEKVFACSRDGEVLAGAYAPASGQPMKPFRAEDGIITQLPLIGGTTGQCNWTAGG